MNDFKAFWKIFFSLAFKRTLTPLKMLKTTFKIYLNHCIDPIETIAKYLCHTKQRIHLLTNTEITGNLFVLYCVVKHENVLYVCLITCAHTSIYDVFLFYFV